MARDKTNQESGHAHSSTTRKHATICGAPADDTAAVARAIIQHLGVSELVQQFIVQAIIELLKDDPKAISHILDNLKPG